MSWKTLNFRQAVGLAILGLIDTQIIGTKASNEFINAGSGGPKVKLQYTRDHSSMKLNAFVPENFDLTIGQVIGLDDDDQTVLWSSKDKHTMGSISKDDDSSQDNWYMEILGSQSVKGLKCGDTYKFFWTTNSTDEESQAEYGTWEQNIDCLEQKSDSENHSVLQNDFNKSNPLDQLHQGSQVSTSHVNGSGLHHDIVATTNCTSYTSSLESSKFPSGGTYSKLIQCCIFTPSSNYTNCTYRMVIPSKSILSKTIQSYYAGTSSYDVVYNIYSVFVCSGSTFLLSRSYFNYADLNCATIPTSASTLQYITTDTSYFGILKTASTYTITNTTPLTSATFVRFQSFVNDTSKTLQVLSVKTWNTVTGGNVNSPRSTHKFYQSISANSPTQKTTLNKSVCTLYTTYNYSYTSSPTGSAPYFNSASKINSVTTTKVCNPVGTYTTTLSSTLSKIFSSLTSLYTSVAGTSAGRSKYSTVTYKCIQTLTTFNASSNTSDSYCTWTFKGTNSSNFTINLSQDCTAKTYQVIYKKTSMSDASYSVFFDNTSSQCVSKVILTGQCAPLTSSDARLTAYSSGKFSTGSLCCKEFYTSSAATAPTKQSCTGKVKYTTTAVTTQSSPNSSKKSKCTTTHTHTVSSPTSTSVLQKTSTAASTTTYACLPAITSSSDSLCGAMTQSHTILLSNTSFPSGKSCMTYYWTTISGSLPSPLSSKGSATITKISTYISSSSLCTKTVKKYFTKTVDGSWNISDTTMTGTNCIFTGTSSLNGQCSSLSSNDALYSTYPSYTTGDKCCTLFWQATDGSSQNHSSSSCFVTLTKTTITTTGSAVGSYSNCSSTTKIFLSRTKSATSYTPYIPTSKASSQETISNCIPASSQATSVCSSISSGNSLVTNAALYSSYSSGSECCQQLWTTILGSGSKVSSICYVNLTKTYSTSISSSSCFYTTILFLTKTLNATSYATITRASQGYPGSPYQTSVCVPSTISVRRNICSSSYSGSLTSNYSYTNVSVCCTQYYNTSNTASSIYQECYATASYLSSYTTGSQLGSYSNCSKLVLGFFSSSTGTTQFTPYTPSIEDSSQKTTSTSCVPAVSSSSTACSSLSASKISSIVTTSTYSFSQGTKCCTYQFTTINPSSAYSQSCFITMTYVYEYTTNTGASSCNTFYYRFYSSNSGSSSFTPYAGSMSSSTGPLLTLGTTCFGTASLDSQCSQFLSSSNTDSRLSSYSSGSYCCTIFWTVMSGTSASPSSTSCQYTGFTQGDSTTTTNYSQYCTFKNVEVCYTTVSSSQLNCNSTYTTSRNCTTLPTSSTSCSTLTGSDLKGFSSASKCCTYFWDFTSGSSSSPLSTSCITIYSNPSSTTTNASRGVCVNGTSYQCSQTVSQTTPQCSSSFVSWTSSMTSASCTYLSTTSSCSSLTGTALSASSIVWSQGEQCCSNFYTSTGQLASLSPAYSSCTTTYSLNVKTCTTWFNSCCSWMSNLSCSFESSTTYAGRSCSSIFTSSSTCNLSYSSDYDLESEWVWPSEFFNEVESFADLLNVLTNNFDYFWNNLFE